VSGAPFLLLRRGGRNPFLSIPECRGLYQVLLSPIPVRSVNPGFSLRRVCSLLPYFPIVQVLDIPFLCFQIIFFRKSSNFLFSVFPSFLRVDAFVV